MIQDYITLILGHGSANVFRVEKSVTSRNKGCTNSKFWNFAGSSFKCGTQCFQKAAHLVGARIFGTHLRSGPAPTLVSHAIVTAWANAAVLNRGKISGNQTANVPVPNDY